MMVLKNLFSIYQLTLDNFEGYISREEIANNAHLKVEEVEEALQKLPVDVKEENGELLYQLEGSCYHPPVGLSAFDTV